MKSYEVHLASRYSDLTATERAVLREVAMYANGDDGVCFASQETLAADTQLSPRTVRRDLAELERLGVLVVVPDRTRRTTVYQVDVARIPAPGARVPAPRASRHTVPPGTTCQGDRHQVPGRPAPGAYDPSGSDPGSVNPSPQPPPASRAGASSDRAEWVADRALRELEDIADRGGDVPGTLDRYERGEGTLVDAWVSMARPRRVSARHVDGSVVDALRRTWADAPDGLRRREICEGLSRAAARWRARGPPGSPRPDPTDHLAEAPP